MVVSFARIMLHLTRFLEQPLQFTNLNCTHYILHLQNKTVYEIASELNRLHSLGLAGQLTPADIVGGTFSLSNIGAVS